MCNEGIIAIDGGTTSIRAVLFDRVGRPAAFAQAENPPVYLGDGRVEQEASTWEKAAFRILSEVSAAGNASGIRAAAVTITANRSCVIPVDSRGEALHPALMWQDTRTDGICRELASRSREVYERSGLPITSVFSAVKMAWIRRERPDVWARTARMLGVQDYLFFLLTGDFVTNRSLASRTNLLSLDSGDWDPVLLDIFGIDSRVLCDLVDPGEVAGVVTPEAAAASGLPAGIPVVTAGGDQQCAALGMGLLDAGDVVANTGTGSYVIGLSDRPVRDPDMRLYCNISALPGRFVAEAASPAAGVAYRWFRDRFYGGPDGGVDGFGAINAEVEASPPGANGVVHMPRFKRMGPVRAGGTGPAGAGPEGPAEQSGGAGGCASFHGIGLATTRGDLARAVLEGVAGDMADNLDRIERWTGPKDRIRAAGGLTRFHEFDLILASLIGRPVVLAAESEATARGAWISAAVRLGLYPDAASAYSASGAGSGDRVIEPDPKRREVYGRLREERRKLEGLDGVLWTVDSGQK